MIFKEKNSQNYMVKMSKLIKSLLAMPVINCSEKDELGRIRSKKEGYIVSISKQRTICIDYNGKKFYLTGRVKENFSGLEIKNNSVLIKYFDGKADTLEYLGNGSFR